MGVEGLPKMPDLREVLIPEADPQARRPGEPLRRLLGGVEDNHEIRLGRVEFRGRVENLPFDLVVMRLEEFNVKTHIVPVTLDGLGQQLSGGVAEKSDLDGREMAYRLLQVLPEHSEVRYVGGESHFLLQITRAPPYAFDCLILSTARPACW